MKNSRQMKAYIAAPIFNEEQLALVNSIRDIVRDAGMACFSPFHASREIWRGRRPADCSPDERMQVLRGNIRNVDDSDLVIAVLGMTDLHENSIDRKVHGKTDTGVVWECSRATTRAGDPTLQYDASDLGHDTPLLLGYVDPRDIRQGKDINLMLAGTLESAVWGLEALKQAVTIFASQGGHRMCQTFPNNIGHEE